MEGYDKLMAQIDQNLLAIERQLMSDSKLNHFLEDYLESERLVLLKKKKELETKCLLLLDVPKGDCEVPETLESECTPEKPVKIVPTQIFRKRSQSSGRTPPSGRYQTTNASFQRSLNKEINNGRVQVYQEHLFRTQSSEKNPFFDFMSTQTDEDSERISEREIEITKPPKPLPRADLISSIGGISARNISYVMDVFHQKPFHKSKFSNHF